MTTRELTIELALGNRSRVPPDEDSRRGKDFDAVADRGNGDVGREQGLGNPHQVRVVAQVFRRPATGDDHAGVLNRVHFAKGRNRFEAIPRRFDRDVPIRMSYNFGVARVDAAYEVMSFKVASGTLKAKYWEVGTQVPVGAANFGLQYSQRDNGTAWAYVPPTGYAIPATTATLSQIANIRNKWTVGGGKHLAFVADYSFSKRSQAYAYFSNLKNETNGKQNTLAIGLIHRF